MGLGTSLKSVVGVAVAQWAEEDEGKTELDLLECHRCFRDGWMCSSHPSWFTQPRFPLAN